MDRADFTRRSLIEKFVFGKTSTDVSKVERIEKYAQSNGAIVTPNAARLLVSYWKKRWTQCKRTWANENRYKSWLDQDLYAIRKTAPSHTEPRGRKRTRFQDLSDSQKRRRTADLRKEDSDVLTFAASCSLRRDGNLAAATAVKQILIPPSGVAKSLDASKKNSPQTSHKMTADEALVISLDSRLTRNDYIRLRKNSRQFRTDSFPSYHNLLKAKSLCYPEGIAITEQEAVVNLQSLLDHTASRLLLGLSEKDIPAEVSVLYKWGFDGSSGHSEFKQGFENHASSDASVLITTLVPVRVISKSDHSIIWENPTASSTRYCRPIRIAYEKESKEVITKEYNRVQSEILQLTSTNIISNNHPVEVNHQLFITMVDGKVINTLLGNLATSRCYICKCGPSEMNRLENKNYKISAGNSEALKYGISPLHARIKFFEFILHLSCRLHLPDNLRKKGSRKTPEEKKIIEARKKEIQNSFRRRLGLLVDVPKPGFGSSNDGNTAPRFFEEEEISSEITGIDRLLIHRFWIILIAINTSQQLDAEKFQSYTIETAKILNDQYGWWPMSPTVHKVLIHGGEVISHAILPLGQLSEEALEHRNKDFKLFRSQFARKSSRRLNLTDVFNRFLLTSDPYIANLRSSTKPRVKHRELPDEVRKLLTDNPLNSADENENEKQDESSAEEEEEEDEDGEPSDEEREEEDEINES